MFNFIIKFCYFNIKYGRSALENVIKSICGMERPMTKFPKTYTGNFLKGNLEKCEFPFGY